VNSPNFIIALSIIIILGLGLLIFEGLYFKAKRRIEYLENKYIKDVLKKDSILNKFSDQLAKIPEVKRVLYSIEEGDLDMYIFFDSSNLSVRFDIYKQSQVIISEAFAYGINVDLHATNLVDFDANQINSLIPSDANSLINR
jgi:hypothetical protein